MANVPEAYLPGGVAGGSDFFVSRLFHHRWVKYEMVPPKAPFKAIPTIPVFQIRLRQSVVNAPILASRNGKRSGLRRKNAPIKLSNITTICTGKEPATVAKRFCGYLRETSLIPAKNMAVPTPIPKPTRSESKRWSESGCLRSKKTEAMTSSMKRVPSTLKAARVHAGSPGLSIQKSLSVLSIEERSGQLFFFTANFGIGSITISCDLPSPGPSILSVS